MKTHFKKTRMINRILLSLIAVLCLGPMAAAQNMQVSGTVTGQDGQPIVGATVVTEQGGGKPDRNDDRFGRYILHLGSGRRHTDRIVHRI